MRFTREAIRIFAAVELGLIKSNANFWRTYSSQDDFDQMANMSTNFSATVEKLETELESLNDENGIICAYDSTFPVINAKVRNKSEKPFLLFYKGNLDLLADLNKNVAVIGLIDPDNDIKEREEEIVKRLVEAGLTIVSGLALGCDSIAHRTTLDWGGKTIAILPSPLTKVIPAENRELATEIVEKGGLLISEYYKVASSKYDAISRFVDRDRLQAMFTKAVILTASYRKDEGDSGSRHAMEAARKYGLASYVMYNEKSDRENKRFRLNRDLAEAINHDSVDILTQSTIEEIKTLINPDLEVTTTIADDIEKQLSLL